MEKSLVLIIEDDADIIEILTEIVKGCNCEVMHAFNGKEALELIERNKLKPALVLCDLQMPIMDGVSFVKQNIVKNLDLNICVVTANNDNAGIVDVLRLGVTDYISKPFNSDELTEKIWLMVAIGERKNSFKKQINDSLNSSIKMNNLLKLKNSQRKIY